MAAIEPTSGKWSRAGVAVALLALVAGGAGAVWHYANAGRQTQLQTDEMGRQRDALNAAAAARAKNLPTTAPAAVTVPKP